MADGLQFTGTGPEKTVYIDGPSAGKRHVVVNDASTKTADIVNMSVGTYPNGVADVGAATPSGALVMEIKALGTNATKEYQQDYTFEDGEEADGLLLVPGMIFWARCADVQTIAINDLLETKAGGLVGVRNTSYTTPINAFKAMAARTGSATESFIPVMYEGRC